jgi:carboxypeptidase family protein/TonB-dependent receptor-like protein
MIRRRIVPLVFSFVLLLPHGSAFAQGAGGSAELSGTIVDQAKAVLPGVTVTVTNQATGQTRQTVTGPEGRFVLTPLVPGTYTVKAELSGFETTTRTGLVLNVGQEISVSLTMSIGGVREEVTVTAESPVIETTSSKIGTNITSDEIDSSPSANRSQFSLMQTIPGLVPTLQVGSFEGGQFSANGQATTNNLFLVDGQYNNDSRLGGSQGTQARVTLDTMAEYQVQTHQYGAEYGGSTGVVVNSVTRSGTNKVSGRAFEYFRSNKLQATDYFLKQAGEENPDSGSNVFGGSVGGPIVRNKLFYFGNIEYDRAHEAANLSFPAIAAPLAVSYSTTTDFNGPNTFGRLDYQVNGNNTIGFRWTRERVLTLRDSIEDDLATADAARYENDSGDQVYSWSWTSVLNNHMTNEFKVGHVRENLLQGPKSLFSRTDSTSAFFDSSWKFVGFQGQDPFDLGSQNSHPDYIAANRNTYGDNIIRDVTFDDSITWLKSGWHGEHTLKAGLSWSRNAATPSGSGTNFIGNITFPTDRPFNAVDPTTYPFRFQISMGQVDFDVLDHRVGSYISDKWTVGNNLTLNLGLRYDWQGATPHEKNAFGPRVGFAYNVGGEGKTLVRGGVGKVFQYTQTPILITLAQRQVIAPSLAYDTTQVTSPATTGTFPVRAGDANATACLNPVAAGTPGEAVISPACRAFLVGLRSQVLAGGFVNTVTAGPIIDSPDRQMQYTWAFSLGVKREIAKDTAVSVDYVGNRGRDLTAVIDINEGPINPATGRVTRLGQSVFNPGNVLGLPAAALSATFVQFNEEQTRSEFNTDYNSLEIELEKRLSNRYSARVSYTFSHCNDVVAPLAVLGASDTNPRADYGRCARDNRHAFATSANVQPWKGLGAGIVFRRYSGYPINETTGVDTNGDGTNNDRPVRGRDDLTIPIRSAVDGSGMAVRNGIQGESKLILDSRVQYIWRLAHSQVGVFLEIYNLTNHVNFGDPTGARNSSNFMVPIVSDDPRTAQLGFRVTF